MKILKTIISIIFWDFLMFYQISLSPQVKRYAIITCKHGTYELPNDLRVRFHNLWIILAYPNSNQKDPYPHPTQPPGTTAPHAKLCYTDIKNNPSRRKKPHRTNKGSNPPGGSFSNGDSIRAPIQFRIERQS